jgi:hypothetical protein
LTSVSRCLRVDSSQSDDGAWNIRVLSIRWFKRSIHLAGNGRLSEPVGHRKQASASIEQRLIIAAQRAIIQWLREKQLQSNTLGLRPADF